MYLIANIWYQLDLLTTHYGYCVLTDGDCMLLLTHYLVRHTNFFIILYIDNYSFWLLIAYLLYQLDVLIDSMCYCVLTECIG